MRLSRVLRAWHTLRESRGLHALRVARGLHALRAWALSALLTMLCAASLRAAQADAAPATEACPPLPRPSALAAPALDRGLMWRLTRDGRSSYLFGTVHVGRPGWEQLGPRTSAALDEADTLAVELDPGDPATQAALMQMPPPPALPQALLQRLQRARVRACLPALALAGVHPVLQVTMLSVIDAQWLGLTAAHGFEWVLLARARSRAQPVVALESAAEQHNAIVPPGRRATLAFIRSGLDQLESQASRRSLARLVDAWERGDLDRLARFDQWCECAHDPGTAEFLRRLNDARNPALAQRIDGLHGGGARVFAAVGALHFTGPKALQRLLAARGYAIERVEFARR